MAGFDITADYPFPLSGRSSSITAEFSRSTVAHDYALAGLPFLSATNDTRPLTRGLAPIRKQQFDNSQEPGEQTLTGWWLRSQSSFHAGTGLKFREPLSDDEQSTLRFFDSLGVDPWTAGQLTLLKSTALNKSGSGTVYVEGIIDGSTDGYLHADGTTLTKETGSSTGITWGGSGTILSLTSDGTNYYVADSTSIWKGTVTGGAGADFFNTGSSSVVIKWVKQRLVAGIGASIYELVSGGPTLPTPNFTHPNSSWVWSAIAEGGSAIYAAGYAGGSSAIYRFTLDSNGAVPTLTRGIVTAQLPAGEVIHSLYVYLGTFVGIGTNKGLRIGVINSSSGEIEYGGLTIETTSPVKCMVGKDRFLWCGATNSLNSNSGLYRVDLSMALSQGRYAYATDLQTGVTGTVASVSTFGASGRLVIGVSASGSYLESASTLESTGYVTTSKIRYDTLEPKLYKFLRVRGSSSAGSILVSTIDETSNTVSLVTYSAAATPGSEDLSLSAFATAQEFVSLKFTLGRDSSVTSTGPTLNGWQLKALPGVIRNELITIPLLCFDHEKDKNGQRWGYEGASYARWGELRDAVAGGDLVTFQDLNNDELRLVIVEELSFTQMSPPSANFRGTGGVIQAQLRTVS